MVASTSLTYTSRRPRSALNSAPSSPSRWRATSSIAIVRSSICSIDSPARDPITSVIGVNTATFGAVADNMALTGMSTSSIQGA